jgi:hypothetical protein
VNVGIASVSRYTLITKPSPARKGGVLLYFVGSADEIFFWGKLRFFWGFAFCLRQMVFLYVIKEKK